MDNPGIAQALADAINKERIAREQREEEERQQRFKDFLVDMQTGTFDKAATYVALLVSGGYVGFFAIWGWVQPYLARWEVLTTALLLGFSLLVFILWQVYVMTILGRQQMQLAETISAPAANFDAAVKKHREVETTQRNRLARVWPVVFLVTTLPGVAGGLLLLFACARHLFVMP